MATFGVFRQAVPRVPAPLVRHADAPEVSFAEQVVPAPQENGFEAHPPSPASEVLEEHATSAEIPAATTNRSEVERRMRRR